ncbi:hypothetical protein IPO96_03330 [Candidatus Saccharibacteria bacterium]|jgi:hypothetical protein|nr:MAG: hypothetical protein IPO96_03330 [Candidatus Saccharibacteria bacterium]
MSKRYTSNPFTASAVGLGRALVVNPVSSLLILVLTTLMLLGIYLLAILLAVATRGSSGLVFVFMLAAFIGVVIVSARASLGSMFILKASREDKELSAKEALTVQAKPYVGRMILIIVLELVLFLVIFLVTMALISVFGSSNFATIIVGILGAAGVSCISAKVSLAPFVLVNENTSSIDSLKTSWELTKDHVVEMLGVMFAQSLVTFGGLASMVGGVSGVDTRYQQIKAYKAAGTAKPRVHWLNWLTIVLMLLFWGIYIAVLNTSLRSKGGLKTNSTNLSSQYCYFDSSDRYKYKCADSKSDCESIQACAKIIESTDRFNKNLYSN